MVHGNPLARNLLVNRHRSRRWSTGVVTESRPCKNAPWAGSDEKPPVARPAQGVLHGALRAATPRRAAAGPPP
jgi:hypothetical protein